MNSSIDLEGDNFSSLNSSDTWILSFFQKSAYKKWTSTMQTYFAVMYSQFLVSWFSWKFLDFWDFMPRPCQLFLTWYARFCEIFQDCRKIPSKFLGFLARKSRRSKTLARATKNLASVQYMIYWYLKSSYSQKLKKAATFACAFMWTSIVSCQLPAGLKEVSSRLNPIASMCSAHSNSVRLANRTHSSPTRRRKRSVACLIRSSTDLNVISHW